MFWSRTFLDERQRHLDSRVIDLEDRWSRDDGLIRDRSLGVNKHDIGLSINASWDNSAVAIIRLSGWRENWARLGRESSKETLARGLEVARWAQLDDRAGDERIVVTGSQDAVDEGEEWEDVHERQLLWALDDVTRGDSVRLRWRQRDVERGWERAALRSRDLLRGVGEEGAGIADVGRVARLDGEDGAGFGEVVLGGDQRRGAEVGGDADGFDGGGELEEGGWVRGREVVGAWLDGLPAEGALEEGDVGLLVGGDGLEVVVEGLGVLVV